MSVSLINSNSSTKTVIIVWRSSWNPHEEIYNNRNADAVECLVKYLKELFEEDAEKHIFENNNEVVIEVADAGLSGLPTAVFSIARRYLGEPDEIIDK